MKKNILFILNKNITEEPRGFRQIKILSENDYVIDVICPNKKNSKDINIKNTTFYYAPSSRSRTGGLNYFFEFVVYFFYCIYKSLILDIRKKYFIVQIMVMPEFMMFSAFVPRLRGAKIIMDWMDPLYEVFISRKDIKKNKFVLFILNNIEKLAVKFSHKVLVPNRGFIKAFNERNIDTSHFFVIPNSADEEFFIIKKDIKKNNQYFQIIYHGVAVNYNGLKITIDAFLEAMKKLPSLKLMIVGDGPEIDYARKVKLSYNLKKEIQIIGRVPINKLHKYLMQADAGIVSNLNTPFTNINLPTRIMELISMKIPVISSKLSGICDYFNKDALMFFEPGNYKELADCILELANSTEKRNRLVNNANEQYREIDWLTTKNKYMQIIQQLSGNKND